MVFRVPHHMACIAGIVAFLAAGAANAACPAADSVFRAGQEGDFQTASAQDAPCDAAPAAEAFLDVSFESEPARQDSLTVLAESGWDELWDPQTAPAGTLPSTAPFGLEYTPWRERRGPAYPDHKWRSVGRDLKELPETLWDDTKHAFTDPIVLGGFGVAAVAGVVLNLHVDSTVADRTAHGQPHLNRWEDHLANDWLGTPATHFPIAAGLYTVGLATNDVKLYETSKAAFNALAINGVSNLILKLAVNNHSPDNSKYAWPSGHTSSSFTLAMVFAEAYGPCVGVPALAFATFVGYERIDSRRHQFSDVISGMHMGIVIGHSVAQNHMTRIMGMDVEPVVNPETHTVGVSLVKRW
jgi:hypothetical protein